MTGRRGGGSAARAAVLRMMVRTMNHSKPEDCTSELTSFRPPFCSGAEGRVIKRCRRD